LKFHRSLSNVRRVVKRRINTQTVVTGVNGELCRAKVDGVKIKIDSLSRMGRPRPRRSPLLTSSSILRVDAVRTARKSLHYLIDSWYMYVGTTNGRVIVSRRDVEKNAKRSGGELQSMFMVCQLSEKTNGLHYFRVSVFSLFPMFCGD
jgi:hypothetical protein